MTLIAVVKFDSAVYVVSDGRLTKSAPDGSIASSDEASCKFSRLAPDAILAGTGSCFACDLVAGRAARRLGPRWASAAFDDVGDCVHVAVQETRNQEPFSAILAGIDRQARRARLLWWTGGTDLRPVEAVGSATHYFGNDDTIRRVLNRGFDPVATDGSASAVASILSAAFAFAADCDATVNRTLFMESVVL